MLMFRRTQGVGRSRTLVSLQARHRRSGRDRAWRAILEPLEDRTVLSANLYTVNVLTDSSGSPGGSGMGTIGDLRYCIAQADMVGNAGSTIQFGATGTISLASGLGGLTLSQNVTIAGPGASSLTVAGTGASGFGSVFTVNSGVTASISGVTISGGNTSSGGGIYNDGTLTLANDTLSTNSASYEGGGVYNYSDGTVTLTDDTLSTNSAPYGGGVFSYGVVTLTDDTLSTNSAYDGGGIFDWGTVTLTNDTLSANSASGNGGGIYNASTVTLTNDTLCANSGFYGGGIENYGTATLTNDTLSENSASVLGGGIDNVGTVKPGNSIVAHNTAGDGYPDVHGAFTSQGHNLIGEIDGSSGWIGSDLTGTSASPLDPMLSVLANNGGPTQTMALMAGSPALDTGSATLSGAPTTDQRGALRGILGLNAGANPDIGAYEASSSYLVTLTTDTTDVGTLRAAVGWANVSTNVNPANSPVATNTVTFDSSLAGQTINLTTVGDTSYGPSAFAITAPVQIIGDAAPGLTIARSSDPATPDFRIFYVSRTGNLTLQEVTISGGQDVSGDGGGGFYNNGTLSLNGDTLTNLTTSYGGGAIANWGPLAVSDCTFTAENALYGGGITSDGNAAVSISGSTFRDIHLDSVGSNVAGINLASGSLVVNGTTFDNNSAYYAGAVDNGGDSTVEIYNSVFSDNSSYCRAAALTVNGFYSTDQVINTTFINNSVQSSIWPYSGGAITVDQYSNLTLTGCTLTGNVGFNGGALHLVNNSAANVSDCTFSGNSTLSGGQGGAIFNEWLSSLDVTNSTIASNTSGGIVSSNGPGPVILTNDTVVGNDGGGIDGYGSIMLENSLVAGNFGSDGVTPADVSAALDPGSSYNLIGDPSSAGGLSNGINGNIVGDGQGNPIDVTTVFQTRVISGSPAPVLADNGGSTQTVALVPGSPAINAGSTSVPDYPTTDQRGISRVGAPDIGAFESRGFIVTISGGDGQSASVNTAFSQPLKVTVTSNYGEPVAGGLVTFTSPGSGASAMLTGNPATIAADGTASVTAAANGTAGSYTVTAGGAGIATSVSFALNNTGADLSVTDAGPATAVAGDPAGFNYTIVVTNNGPSDNTGGFTVTDVLPAGLTFHNAGSTAGASANGQTVTFTNATGLASGASETITIHVTLIHSAVDSSVLDDTATVATNGTVDPSSTNNTSNTVSTTVQTRADLAVSVSNPSTTLAGTDLTYTVTITNGGPSDAQTVSLSGLSIPANTAFVSYTSAAGWSSTPAPAVGATSGSITASIGTLPAGASGTFTFKVQVNGFTAGGTPISLTATGTTATTDPTPSDNNNVATGTSTVTLIGAGLATNLANPSQVNLVADGNTVAFATVGSQVGVVVNGTYDGAFSPTGRLVSYGRGTNDRITVASTITLPATLYGSGGGDTLVAGGGDSVLVGGGGSATLVSGAGHNILISGGGSVGAVKTLSATLGNNIMIGGSTNWDHNDQALGSLLAEWGRTDLPPSTSYATRVNDLLNGGGLNGSFTLNSTTVHDNGVRDTLIGGGAGQNWYLAHVSGAGVLDIIVGKKNTETVTAI